MKSSELDEPHEKTGRKTGLVTQAHQGGNFNEEAKTWLVAIGIG
jgi:hypothetical protein